MCDSPPAPAGDEFQLSVGSLGSVPRAAFSASGNRHVFLTPVVVRLPDTDAGTLALASPQPSVVVLEVTRQVREPGLALGTTGGSFVVGQGVPPVTLAVELVSSALLPVEVERVAAERPPASLAGDEASQVVGWVGQVGLPQPDAPGRQRHQAPLGHGVQDLVHRAPRLP